jgi:pimeloyl-ACP methyl ester carboxylesterase
VADLHHAVSTPPARLDGLPTLPGVEHHWLDVQTGSGPVRLHLAATGSGPPVLLLHGWPQHWWCWRRVVKQLRDYRLLIPDLRGFGWSEAPGSGYSPTGFADDAVALLDAHDIARAHLFSDADATVYADQFRDRSYWRLAHAILLRRAFEGQRLQAPTQVLFGANDFYIPRGGARGDRAHRADLTLEVVEGCSHWMLEAR